MQVPDHLLAMVVVNSTNPEQIARYAELLGDQVTSAPTKVSIPAPWALAAQKRSVAQAAFAAANCHDEATLDKIARTTRRVAVRSAIANNKNASSDTLRFLLTEAKASKNYDLIHDLKAALNHVPFEQRAAHYVLNAGRALGSDNAPEVQEFLADARTTDDEVRAIVSAALQSGHSWLLKEYVCDNLGWSERYLWEEDLPRWTDRQIFGDPMDAFALLPKSTQRSILNDAIDDLVRASHRDETVQLLPARVTEQVMAHLRPKNLLTKFYYDAARIFDEESLDLLIADPAWHAIAVAHVLSDEQFKTLAAMNTRPTTLNTSDTPTRLLLFRHVGESRERLEYLLGLLGLLGPEDVIDPHVTTSVADLIENAVTDPKDPLITRLCAHASTDELQGYLLGKWVVSLSEGETIRILPDLEDVPALSKKAFGEELSPWELVQAASTLETLYAIAETRQHATAAIKHAPGLLNAACSRPGLSQVVFTELTASGAELELALLQLANNPDVALVDLCESLSRLAK